MSLELKSFEYYDKLKIKFNKNCNIFLKKYISSACIGQCTYLFDKYNPKTADEFIISYTTDCDDNFDTVNFRGNKTKGRSYDDLRSIAHGLYKDLSDNNLLKENNITFEECYDEIINHCIIETFNGKKYELFIKNVLSNNGYIVQNTNGKIDEIYGIDIIAKKNDKYRYFQIKPVTAFIGNKNQSLIEDRINFYRKEYDWNTVGYKQYNLPKGEILYMCYDKNKKDIAFLKNKNTNRHFFRLNELCNTNGETLIEYKNCIFEKI